MNVAHVLELPKRNGGAERCFEMLASGVARAGAKTSVVAVGRSVTTEMDAVLQRLSANCSVHVTTLSRVRRVLRESDSDVIHWHFASPFAFEAGLPILALQAAHVTTDHLPQLRAGFRWETTRRLANRRLRAAIVVGNSARAAAQAHWPMLRSLRVVRNGIPIPSAFRVRKWESPAVLHLVFVGRLEEQKDPLFVLDVMAALRNRGVLAELLIAGTGTLQPAVELRVRELGIEGSVNLLGHVDDVGQALDSAHLLLSTSRWEGLPLAPIEALVTGVPVIASDIPPHRELANLSSGLSIVSSRDPVVWADRILEIAPALESRSSAALANRAIFSIEQAIAETLAIYEEAAA